jgi:NAD(P)-dependent dehydrogenase (short-subunit alcohol dehydrogenase family)
MAADAERGGPIGLGRFDLTGRRVLLTGASQGIGRELARGMAECGAWVYCVARSEDKLASLVEEIEASGGEAAYRAVSLRGADEIRATVAAMVEEMGGIDVLVNNAADDHDSSIEDTDPEVFSRVLELNLTSCYLLCREAGEALKADGGGKVINVASLLGHVGVRDNVAYVSSKSGLVGLTRSLALEWARQGVQVNALCPGFFETEMTEHVWGDEAANRWIIRRTPAGRWGQPEDLVGATVFLASAASDFMTGASLIVDGGYTAQ